MGVVGEFTIGDGTIIGEDILPGHPLDLAQRIYSGLKPWLDDTPELDSGPVERSAETHVYALDENWQTIEEIQGITEDRCIRSARLFEGFCQEEDFTFTLEDPSGLYSPDGSKYDLLRPRALLRVVKRVFNDYGVSERSVMVYRITTIPAPDDDGNGYSASYKAVDWARDFLDSKMPIEMYQIAWWIFQAQGYTTHESADPFAPTAPEGGILSDTQPGIFTAGDALFSGVPLTDYSGYAFPPEERDCTAEDWRYTMLGYLYINMAYLTGRRFTLEGRFTDVSGQTAFGKPPVEPLSLGAPSRSGAPFAARGSKYPPQGLPRRTGRLRPNASTPAPRSDFGVRGVDVSLPADLGSDPVDRWNFGQFWGSPEEWPTYKQFLASMFAGDFFTRNQDGFLRYGVYPGILVYDNEGTLHLRATDDAVYKGIGFSCAESRGQVIQLPIETISREPRDTGPDFNRVIIERVEPAWFNDTDIVVPGGVPERTEVFQYADEHVNTRWFKYADFPDKTMRLGLNVSWYQTTWHNWFSEDELIAHRAGLSAIAQAQARGVLRKYVAAADTARITLDSAFNLCGIGDIVLLYDPPEVSGYYTITAIEQPQNDEAQSWTLSWFNDA